MNRHTFSVILTFLLSSMILFSCSTDVDLYADGEETTIVYGYIDCDADTNYLKITKSFIGDATQLAQDYNASNYDYKLNVKIIGKFADHPNTISTEILDTVSVYKPYDPNSMFYSGRNQVMYYTTRKFKEHENYQLVIERNDGEIIRSNVNTISGSKIRKPVLNISFESDITNQIKWAPNIFKDLAAYYEVVGYFHYKQLNPGETDTVRYTMKWNLGAGTGEELYNTSDDQLFVNYTPSTFYSQLAANSNIVNNSPTYVQRFVEGFEIVITATGDELYNYILIQNSNSAIQDTPDYTNIENGIGILSSRSVCSKLFPINEHTINTLIRDYPEWGFTRIYN